MNTSDVIDNYTDAQVLAEVLTILQKREHKADCAGQRIDACSCGRDSLIHRVEQMQDELTECEHCDGSGEVRLTNSNSLHPDNWTRCKVCHGEGHV